MRSKSISSAEDILYSNPSTLVEEANLADIWSTLKKLTKKEWTYKLTRQLDSVYLEFVARAERTNFEDQNNLANLELHLEQLTHDSMRQILSSTEIDYFSRWKAFKDLVSYKIEEAANPGMEKVLQKKYVKEIIEYLSIAGEAAQSELAKNFKLQTSNTTRVMKLMRRYNLIDIEKNGVGNVVRLGHAAKYSLKPEKADTTTQSSTKVLRDLQMSDFARNVKATHLLTN